MASVSPFRHEDVAAVPRGWKVRTVTHPSGHRVRIAFPPGRRQKGAGQLVSILHPRGNPCGTQPPAPSTQHPCSFRDRFRRHHDNPSLEEFITDSKGRTWGISVFGEGARWTAEAYPVKGRRVGRPIIVHAPSESEAYDQLSEKIDRKNPDRQSEIGNRKTAKARGNPRHSPKNPLTAEALQRMADAAARRGLVLPNPQPPAPSPEEEKAAKLYRSFHGRDPKTVSDEQAANEVRGTYSALGKLAELVFRAPSGRRVALDFSEEQTKLASNPEGTQLYLIGGNQELNGQLESFGSDTTKDFVDLGEALSVTYLARKSFTQFKLAGWKHKFGEEGGTPPWAFYDKLRKHIYLVGGTYKIPQPLVGTSPGIVD